MWPDLNRECGGKSDCQGDEGQSLQGLRDVLGNAIYYFDLIKLILLMGWCSDSHIAHYKSFGVPKIRVTQICCKAIGCIAFTWSLCIAPGDWQEDSVSHTFRHSWTALGWFGPRLCFSLPPGIQYSYWQKHLPSGRKKARGYLPAPMCTFKDSHLLIGYWLKQVTCPNQRTAKSHGKGMSTGKSKAWET